MFTHKSTILKSALYAVIVAVMIHVDIFLIPTVHAAGIGVPVKESLGDDLVSLMSYMGYINTFMHIMLFIILQFLGYLLQADFFNNPIMMGSLNSIWVLSRDIMNIIFALMLIAVSFYVIITGKTDKAKEKIVNFVVAVVLVNFSWFFPRVILDVANILTATVYSIPNMLNFTCETLDDNNQPTPCRVVVDVLIFPEKNPVDATGQPYCPIPGASCSCLENIECHKTDTYENAKNTMAPAHAMINGLAVSFARITMLAKIPTSTTGIAPGGGGAAPLDDGQAIRVSLQIAVSILLALIIQIGVVLPLLGLAVGLFIRIVILWVTTAFMPFSFLGYVINGKLGTNIFEFETDIWKEFLNAAFLPVTIAVPMVIGFIMLSAVAEVPAPDGMMRIGVPILAGVKTWWQLLWMLAAVGIIWTGAFAALSKSKIIGKFTDKIKGFGESVFGSALKIPLLIPLPLPQMPNANLGTLVNAHKIAGGVISTVTSGTSGLTLEKAFKQRLGSPAGTGNPDALAQTLKNDADANTIKVVQALEALKTSGANSQPHIDHIKEAIGETNLKNIDALTLLRQTMERLPVTSKLGNSDSIDVINKLIAKETPDVTP